MIKQEHTQPHTQALQTLYHNVRQPCTLLTHQKLYHLRVKHWVYKVPSGGWVQHHYNDCVSFVRQGCIRDKSLIDSVKPVWLASFQGSHTGENGHTQNPSNKAIEHIVNPVLQSWHNHCNGAVLILRRDLYMQSFRLLPWTLRVEQYVRQTGALDSQNTDGLIYMWGLKSNPLGICLLSN